MVRPMYSTAADTKSSSSHAYERGEKMSRLPKLEASEMMDEKESYHKEDMTRAAEAKLDLEVEREWKQIQSDSCTPKVEVSRNPLARKICRGLVINHMNMRCADTGRLMWQSDEWAEDVFEVEQEAKIPAEILRCPAVSREINFSSVESIDHFRLEQRLYLDGSCVEEWIFNFGFVMPNSTNSWQQTIEAEDTDNMFDPELISGKLVIETGFYDGDMTIAKTVYRIYYV